MEKYLAKEIKEIERLIGNKLVENEKPSDNLNHTQVQIMFYLLKNQDKAICQRDIEKEVNLKKASITETLDSLEKKGIIDRVKSDDDKRKNNIVLTQKALGGKDKIESKIKDVECLIRKGIDQQSLDCFYNVIDKIKENLK